MQFGTLGEIVFKPMFQPESLASSQSFRIATHSRLFQYPNLEFLGPDTRTRTLSITLHKEWCDIESTLQTLQANAENGQVLPLILGGKKEGDYMVQSIRKEGAAYKTDGKNLISIKINLELVEVQ